MKSKWATRQKGFTIVELLIVIVIIAILAAISIVAYNGIQQRARDSQRLQDVKTIAKAMEAYYIDNGVYPPTTGSTKINSTWVSTSDGSWSNLETALVPKYLSSLPKDPGFSTTTQPAIYGGSNYDLARLTANCDGITQQKYVLTYKLEGQSQKREVIGTCTTNPIADYAPSSEYIVVK